SMSEGFASRKVAASFASIVYDLCRSDRPRPGAGAIDGGLRPGDVLAALCAVTSRPVGARLGLPSRLRQPRRLGRRRRTAPPAGRAGRGGAAIVRVHVRQIGIAVAVAGTVPRRSADSVDVPEEGV